MSYISVKRTCIGIAAVLLALSGPLSCSRPPAEQSEPVSAIGPRVNQPLRSFNQVIQSSVHNLTVSVNEQFDVPVRIENPGTEIWASAGSAPINVSYEWFRNGKRLSIEGERTSLPKPVGPKTFADVILRVVGLDEPGKYELRITLVQESVAWFTTKGANYLAIPVLIR